MIATLPKLPPRRGEVRNDYGKDPKLEGAVEWWNKLADRYGLARVIKLTGTRARHVRARMEEEEFDLDLIALHVHKSSFLRGSNARGWKLEFDWLFGSAQNYLKILEGKYDDRAGQTHATPGGREIFTNDTIARVAAIARNSTEGNARRDLSGNSGG